MLIASMHKGIATCNGKTYDTDKENGMAGLRAAIRTHTGPRDGRSVRIQEGILVTAHAKGFLVTVKDWPHARWHFVDTEAEAMQIAQAEGDAINESILQTAASDAPPPPYGLVGYTNGSKLHLAGHNGSTPSSRESAPHQLEAFLRGQCSTPLNHTFKRFGYTFLLIGHNSADLFLTIISPFDADLWGYRIPFSPHALQRLIQQLADGKLPCDFSGKTHDCDGDFDTAWNES